MNRTDSLGPADEPVNVMSLGDFATEAEAWKHFDQVIGHSKSFRSYPEVTGQYVCNPPGKQLKTPRIDRVLVPHRNVIDAGWPHGPIGIEGKRSGQKAGAVVSQALDYSQATFELMKGFHVWLEWVFIYPFDVRAVGDLQSIMSQNRIGHIRCGGIRRPLVFCGDGRNGIELIREESSFQADIPTYRIQAKPLPSGRKRGNRK